MTGGSILIVGKSGQLARCLIEEAAASGVRVTAVGRPELDLQTLDAIDPTVDALRPRAIINTAAYTAVDRAESEPKQAFAVNRDAAGRLAAAAARQKIPFVHISTDYVFDGSREGSYSEADLTAPVSIYGLSKREGELAVQREYPEALIVRTSWVYSAHGQNFVTTMLRLAETQNVVRVVADQHGSPTSAHDLAAALLQLAEQLANTDEHETSGLYHLTGTGATTWHGFAAAIFTGWERRGFRIPKLEPIATEDYPTRAARPQNSRLDCGKIEQRFGIRLPQWQQSLEACLDRLGAAKAERR